MWSPHPRNYGEEGFKRLLISANLTQCTKVFPSNLSTLVAPARYWLNSESVTTWERKTTVCYMALFEKNTSNRVPTTNKSPLQPNDGLYPDWTQTSPFPPKLSQGTNIDYSTRHAGLLLPMNRGRREHIPVPNTLRRTVEPTREHALGGCMI